MGDGDGCRWLLHQRREVGHLLLQSGDLGGQGAQRLEGGEQLSTELRPGRWWGRGSRGRPLLRKASQAAMMGTGQQQQVLTGQSFAARLAGMGLHRQLSLSEPTAQGFAINAK